MADNTDESDLAETVEELKIKLETMRELLDYEAMEKQERKLKRGGRASNAITGKFLSMVFLIVLLTIVLVSGYAFTNLFVAMRKKYPGHHSEL